MTAWPKPLLAVHRTLTTLTPLGSTAVTVPVTLFPGCSRNAPLVKLGWWPAR